MMDELGKLVQNLAVIIIITTFLELLMPSNKLQRYVQLILGLFVIVIILNPVLAFLDKKTEFEMGSWSGFAQGKRLETILAEGKSLSEESQKKAVGEYQGRLEKQMAALVKLIPGVEEVEVTVKLMGGQSFDMSGGIEEVFVEVKAAGGNMENFDGASEVAPVEPVEINKIGGEAAATSGNETKGKQKNNIKFQIISTICDFYGLDRERVKVRILRS